MLFYRHAPESERGVDCARSARGKWFSGEICSIEELSRSVEVKGEKCLNSILQIEYIRGSLKVLSSKGRSDISKECYVVVLSANATEFRIRLPEHLEGIDDRSLDHGKLTLHLNEVRSYDYVFRVNPNAPMQPEADLHVSSPFITELRSLCRRAYRTLEGKEEQKRGRSKKLKLVTKVVPDTPEKLQARLF